MNMRALRRRIARLVHTRLARDRAGATTLEFGLIAVPMFMLTFGVIEYGRAIWANQVLERTATYAARCMGVLSPSCSAGGSYSATATTGYIQQLLSEAAISTTDTGLVLDHAAQCSGIPGATGFSQVSITYNFVTVLPALLPQANGLALSAQACFPNQS